MGVQSFREVRLRGVFGLPGGNSSSSVQSDKWLFLYARECSSCWFPIELLYFTVGDEHLKLVFNGSSRRGGHRFMQSHLQVLGDFVDKYFVVSNVSYVQENFSTREDCNRVFQAFIITIAF